MLRRPGAVASPGRAPLDETRFFEAEGLDPPSNRSFGLTFAGFALVAAWVLFDRGNPHWMWSVGAAAVLAVLGLAQSRLLTYPNRLWTGFGEVMGHITNPIVVLIFYSLLITPLAFVLRLTRRDFFPRRFDANADSYWIERTEDDRAPPAMNRPF